jgi:hypothetical protein
MEVAAQQRSVGGVGGVDDGDDDSSSPPSAGGRTVVGLGPVLCCDLFSPAVGLECWPDLGPHVSGANPSAVLQSRLGVLGWTITKQNNCASTSSKR